MKDNWIKLKLSMTTNQFYSYLILIGLITAFAGVGIGYLLWFQVCPEDRYNQGYQDGLDHNYMNIPNSTLIISSEANIYANWNWNSTFINSTQLINARISCNLYRWQYINSIIQMFDSMSNWYYNLSGESTEENYPEAMIFGVMPNQQTNLGLSFELYYNTITEQFDSINSTIFGDLTGEYVMSNAINFEIKNDSAELYWGIWSIGISFYIGSGEFNTFYVEYLSILNYSGMHENSTAGDWFAYWSNKLMVSYEPLRLDLRNGKEVKIIFGDLNLWQNEKSLYNFDSLEKTLMYNKKGVQYLLNSSGNHVA